MEKRIIAYAITHAPPGVKGGPYESKRGGYGDPWPTLMGASQWRGARGRGPDEEDLELARMTLADVRKVHPDARVIRIVRKARPSGASATAVLRELVADLDSLDMLTTSALEGALEAIRHLADLERHAVGADPMPVVRAAMARRDARAAHAREDASPAPRRQRRLADAWRVFTDAERAEDAAVDAYRKAGGK